MRVTILKTFWDLEADCPRFAGDLVELDKERFAVLSQVLPGYVEAVKVKKGAKHGQEGND